MANELKLKKKMRKALIVGIDKYKERPLNGCVNDAKEMEKVLSHHHDRRANFSCKTFLAPNKKKGTQSKDISRKLLRKQLTELFRHEAEVALFYFSGHGFEDRFGAYLVTQDAESYDEGIALTEVINHANGSQIPHVIIILDCCHSGNIGNPPLMHEHAFLRKGVSILTSSASSQLSFEKGGQGRFTETVLSALNGGAADIIGDVDVADIYNYVNRLFGPWEQRPILKSYVSSLVPIRKCQARFEVNELQKIIEFFKKEDSEFALAPSFEPDLEPRDEKKESIFRLLQRFNSAGLVIPVKVDHMYHAAEKSTGCKLTLLGKYYWKRVKKNML